MESLAAKQFFFYFLVVVLVVERNLIEAELNAQHTHILHWNKNSSSCYSTTTVDSGDDFDGGVQCCQMKSEEIHGLSWLRG